MAKCKECGGRGYFQFAFSNPKCPDCIDGEAPEKSAEEANWVQADDHTIAGRALTDAEKRRLQDIFRNVWTGQKDTI